MAQGKAAELEELEALRADAAQKEALVDRLKKAEQICDAFPFAAQLVLSDHTKLRQAALAPGNEFQLKELDLLRTDVAEKDALVVRLTQEHCRVFGERHA